MKPFEVSLALHGGLEDLGRLHAWLDRFAEQGVTDRALLRIRQVLAEAFSNAVLHAHGGAAGPPVRITVAYHIAPKPHFRIDVTDQGAGFAIPPPAPPDDHAERGRGFLILRKLADRIEYAGNTLSLWLPAS